MNDTKGLKYQFIFDQIFQNAINASFSTRNPKFPIYNKNVVKSQILSSELKKLIKVYIDKFQDGEIDEEGHFAEIENISKLVSADERFVGLLYGSKFRIGISQKLLNLTLKYLWCIDKIKEPFHCPIDSIVVNNILSAKPDVSLINWTKLDSMDDYRKCVAVIAEIAKPSSIAQWELNIWNNKF
jgi:hypothetical protein